MLGDIDIVAMGEFVAFTETEAEAEYLGLFDKDATVVLLFIIV